MAYAWVKLVAYRIAQESRLLMSILFGYHFSCCLCYNIDFMVPSADSERVLNRPINNLPQKV